MKKNLLFTWLAFLFTVVTFSQTLDQSSTVNDAQYGSGLVGQSFVAGIKGTLSKFSYYYYPGQFFVSSGASDYQLLIYSGTGNSGTLLGTQSFSVTQATPVGELEIPITAPVELVAGNTYTIYVSNPTYARSGFGVSVGSARDPLSYAAGQLFTEYGSFPYDMWFKTYVTPIAPATHLNFDGIDDYVELPSAIEPNLQNNVTVEFWMKSNVTPDQDDALFAHGQFGLGLTLNSNGTVQFSGSGGFATINSTTSVTDGEWHHVAGSFINNSNGTNANLYIDGVLESTTTAYVNGKISFSPSPATIGANSAVPGRNYNGSIEDLRIWNVARTASQISANKACELTGTETKLLAYYTFNQGFGGADNTVITNLTDATTNVNNGILVGFSKTGTISNFLTDASLNTTTIATVTTPVNYSVGATATALTATTDGSSLVWYDMPTGGTPLNGAPTPSTTTVGSTSYWVSANAKGCESTRTEIVVTINPILPATYLNFDGVNDNVSLPVAIGNTLSNGTELTIEYWFKGTNLQSAVRLQSGSNYIVAGWGTGSPQFIVSTDGGTNGVQIADVSAVYDNNWHHVACVWKKNGSFSTYLDGALSNSLPASNVNLPVFTDVATYLGAFNGSSEFTKGSLDDVRIWNVAKTAAEINSSKNCALQGNETGLVAYYNFNQGNGGEDNTSITSLTDAVGNNNGTLNGFALNGNTSNFLAKDAPLPNLGYTFTKTNASCNGLNDGSIAVSVYGGQAPYSFTWSNGATTSSITGLSAGTYGLIAITGANGCTLRGSDNFIVPLASITITEPLPLGNPTVTNPVTYNQNDTATALTAITGANGTGLVWFTTDTGGTALTTAPTPSTTTIGNTSYWVASTNANGCETGRTEIVVTVSSVAKIEIKVTATASQSKVYGATEPVFTYTFTPSLANGDTFTGSLSREAGEDVGTYAIAQGTLSAGANYVINFVAKDFAITAKPITVTADASQTKVYGATDPSLTYSVSPSLLGTDAFIGTLARVTGENVGTYAIGQNNLSAGSNYTINYVSADFSISKANQVISWNQTLVSNCNGTASTVLTATATSGLPISYTSSNTTVATVSNDVLTYNVFGLAMITALQSGDNNYNASQTIVLPVVNSQSNLIRQQFEDVIFFDNSSKEFSTYTWYKNGIVVPGQTLQYYKEIGGLNGTYYAVSTKLDGTIVTTCPLILSATAIVENIKILPNPVDSNSSFQLVSNVDASKMQNAQIDIFGIDGALLQHTTTNESTTTLQAPAATGIYIVKLTLSNGNYFTKNLLVKN